MSRVYLVLIFASIGLFLSFAAYSHVSVYLQCYNAVIQYRSLRSKPYASTVECVNIYNQIGDVPCKEGVCK